MPGTLEGFVCPGPLDHQISLRAGYSHVPICRGETSPEGKMLSQGDTGEGSGGSRQPGDTARACDSGSVCGSGSSAAHCARAPGQACAGHSSVWLAQSGPNQGEEFSLELCLMKAYVC